MKLRNPVKSSKYTFDHYCKLIRKAKKRVILSGSETTLYIRIFDLIKLAKGRKISQVELQSNGLTLSYNKWAKIFVDSGVTEFNINFPSHIEETNDKLTQTKGTLKKRISGVKNLEELGANIRLTYVINSLNYKEMPSFVDFVNENFDNITVIFTYLQNVGNVKTNNWLIPSYSEIKKFLQRALSKPCVDNKFQVEGVPFCFLGNHRNKAVDYQKILDGDTFFPIPSKKLEFCRVCSDNRVCRGIPFHYLELFGTKEFGLRANLKNSN